MIKTEIRYKILRIRCKISLMAYIKKQTVVELLMRTILSTSINLKKYGLVSDTGYVTDLNEREALEDNGLLH